MKKLLILPLALFLLVQSGWAQTPKWVEKAKRAVFSVVTYDKNDKILVQACRSFICNKRLGKL